MIHFGRKKKHLNLCTGGLCSVLEAAGHRSLIPDSNGCQLNPGSTFSFSIFPEEDQQGEPVNPQLYKTWRAKEILKSAYVTCPLHSFHQTGSGKRLANLNTCLIKHFITLETTAWPDVCLCTKRPCQLCVTEKMLQLLWGTERHTG